jgi:hypothetical protein
VLSCALFVRLFCTLANPVSEGFIAPLVIRKFKSVWTVMLLVVACDAANVSAVSAPSALPEAAQAMLIEMQGSPRYGLPTAQDLEGFGIHPRRGSEDARSETNYPPFILSPRRQTDQLVRQLYALLPLEVRRSNAFVLTDRITQRPEAYLNYLRSRPRIVVMGNFVGIGKATRDGGWFTRSHQQELDACAQTIRLAQGLGLEVAAVRYTMGDSISEYSVTVRDRLQAKLDEVLVRHGLTQLKSPISWGADEMAPVAFAAALPPLKVRLTYATENCRHYWDGGRTSREIMARKLGELGLTEVNQGFDFEAVILTNVEGQDGAFPGVERQRALDWKTMARFTNYTAAQRERLVILDARLFNGSWNAEVLPSHDDYLAYGGWGTFGNVAGATLATAKVLFHARNPVARRQLLLESVAHDVFANGYVDGRNQFIPLLRERGIEFRHGEGYRTEEEVRTVFEIVNRHVNARMQSHYAGTTAMKGRTVRLTPQLWRTFECETHLLPVMPGELRAVGIHQTDLSPETFDPTAGNGLKRLTLEMIERE